MTKLSDVKVYQGKSGNIIFELDNIKNGFANARPRQNSVFLKTGKFDSYCFSISMIRDATEQEAKEYNALKEAFILKEFEKAVPMKDLYRGEIFRLPLQTDRYRVLGQDEEQGQPITKVLLLGRNTQGKFDADTKAIKL
jgi:hypothetical protein